MITSCSTHILILMLFMNNNKKRTPAHRERENNVYAFYFFLLFKVKYNGIDLNYIFSTITLSTYNSKVTLEMERDMFG